MNAPPSPRLRSLQTALGSLKPVFSGPRLLVAAKTALAAGAAWWLAHLFPDQVSQYSYYAPLGAVLSMSPTLVGSFRQGLQTLIGLAIGILLAWAVIWIDVPVLLSMSIAVAFGVLFGGFQRLGAGRDYVVVAALLVLVIGGANPGTYSVSYLVEMAVGVLVGLAVNATVFPPLTVKSAVLKLSGFRLTLAKYLDDMGVALTEKWPPEHERWAASTAGLAATATEVRDALSEANESRRANPRAWRHRRDFTGDHHEDLETLENVSFHIRDISETLASAVWGSPFSVTVPNELFGPLSRALRAAAELLRAEDSGADEPAARAVAQDALDALFERLSDHHAKHRGLVTGVASVAFDLHRIVQRTEPRPDGADR